MIGDEKIMASSPLLSIVVPFYNSEKRISRLLYSLDKVDSRVEVNFIDNNSKDNTLLIIEELAKKHQNFHVFQETTRGVSAARNKGMMVSTGDFIWFVDADDDIKPGSTSIILEVLTNFDVDLVVFPLRKVVAKNENLKRDDTISKPATPGLSVIDHHELVMKLLHGADERVGGYACNKVYRSKVIQSVWFKDMYFEDLPYFAESLRHIKDGIFLDDALYYYYQYEDSRSHSADLEKIQDFITDIDISKSALLSDQQNTLMVDDIQSYSDRYYLDIFFMLRQIRNSEKKQLFPILTKRLDRLTISEVLTWTPKFKYVIKYVFYRLFLFFRVIYHP